MPESAPRATACSGTFFPRRSRAEASLQLEEGVNSTMLLLVRHAATIRHNSTDPAMNGWADVPLSHGGREQAIALGRRLAEEAPEAVIYASPLRRTVETAQPLAERLGRAPVPLRSIREIHCGIVDGWPTSRVMREYPEWWEANLAQADDDFRWPEGESYRHFRSRCLRAIRALNSRHPAERVIVVTHTGVITQLLGAFCGISAARWDTWRPHHASITRIEVCGDDAMLHTFDDHEHLRGTALKNSHQLPVPGSR